MNPIKALVINGSPHINGATASVLHMVVGKIKEPIEYEWVNAYDLQIKACQGCMKCRPDKKCALPPDDGHRMGEKLKEADLLIVGSPSYWSNMPAPLKVIFDRNVAVLEYCLDKPPVPKMIGKKAIIVATCASPEPRSETNNQLPLLVNNLSYILGGSGYSILQVVKVPSSWQVAHKKAEIQALIETFDFGIL